MECDGCGTYYHTYCVGLDSVPAMQWFCDSCQATRAIESVSPNEQRQRAAVQPTTRLQSEPSTRARNERRTRGQQRRLRNRAQATSSNWARVWQSVWDNLNLDLDFPFSEDNGAARELDRATRASSQRREFQEWERRLQVAERQGGANRFRETAALLDLHAHSRERPGIPEPESREEILAWNAFEKAKEIELDPAPKRKRKSATTSPVEPITESITEPGRPLKRPRTRRNLDHVVETSSSASHTSRRGSGDGPSSSRLVSAQSTNGNAPSFLQSMLKEIETSTAPDESAGPNRLANSTATNYSSPRPSSPGLSPTTSNHATPRPSSTTPPPQVAPRPSSPLSLTSKVEPIFPPAEFSPNRSPPEPSTLAHRNHRSRQSRSLNQDSSPPASRSEDTSPTRANMPLSTKTDLQKMVSTALKPHYQNNSVNKDQYTDINRNVSHMLYDRYGESGALEGQSKEGWERLASDEVAKAVKELKATT